MLLKVYILSVVITAIFSFYIWEIVSAITFPDGNGPAISFLSNFGTYTIQVLMSTSCFIGIQKISKCLINKVKLIKIWFLGNDYVDGYWVGYLTKSYKSEDGIVKKDRLVIEYIKQSATDILIDGWAYDMDSINPTRISYWTSQGYPIQVKNGKLIFGYNTKFYNVNIELVPEVTTGFVYYDLRTAIDEKETQHNIPNELSGYFINLLENDKNDLHMKKVVKSYDKYRRECKRNGEKPLEKIPYFLKLAKTFYESYSVRD